MITVLGVETSSAVCSIGLADESGPKMERSIIESRIHSEKILTLVQQICKGRNMTLAQLNGIAVSIGPGSFTGLRIGLSTAKGLCYSTGLPLVAVPTFEAVAFRVFAENPEFIRIVICIDAKQGEFYRSIYEIKDGKIRNVIPVEVVQTSEVVDSSLDGGVLVTDHIDIFSDLNKGSFAIKSISGYFRGDTVADLAVRKIQAGSTDILENTIEPLYLKDFIVRVKAKSEKNL